LHPYTDVGALVLDRVKGAYSSPELKTPTKALTGLGLPHEALQREARRRARNHSGRTNIGDIGRWSNGQSPGWCTAIAGFAIAAWPKTITGCTTAPQHSTCVGWSTSAWTSTGKPGR
jgi:hypothetical protein